MKLCVSVLLVAFVLLGAACGQESLAPLGCAPNEATETWCDIDRQCHNLSTDLGACGSCETSCGALFGGRVDACIDGACGCTTNGGEPCAEGAVCQPAGCIAAVCNGAVCPDGCCVGRVCTAPTATTCGIGGATCLDCATTAAERADSCSPSGGCECAGSGRLCSGDEVCLAVGCVTYAWDTGAWSDCATTCADETRTVTCRRSDGTDMGGAADVYEGCASDSRPSATRECTDPSCCVATVGESCTYDVQEVVPGCAENYGCADFIGIYYNSPNGCDPLTAGSWIEYRFDGTREQGRSSNDAAWSDLGDATSAYHCTYIGFAYYDPFHGVADGTCVNSSARGYSIEDTFTRVVPGNSCYRNAWVTREGTVTCSGACE